MSAFVLHPSTSSRRRVVLGAVAALAGVFAARLLSEGAAGQGLTFLFAYPIAAIAFELGALAGAGIAAVSLLLVGGLDGFGHADIGVLGYCTRTAVFAMIVVLAGRARRADRRSALAETPAAAEPPSPAFGERPGLHVVGAGPGEPPLTRRELEVLQLIAAGHTNREAADQLVLSVRTVEAHRARLQAKIGLSGRAELFRYALEHGLVDATGDRPAA